MKHTWQSCRDESCKLHGRNGTSAQSNGYRETETELHAHITYHPAKGPARRDRAMVAIPAIDQAAYLADSAGMTQIEFLGACERHGADVLGRTIYAAEGGDGSALHVNLCALRH